MLRVIAGVVLIALPFVALFVHIVRKSGWEVFAKVVVVPVLAAACIIAGTFLVCGF